MTYTSDIFEEGYVRELIEWAGTAKLPDESFQLTDWMFLEVPKRFIQDNLDLLKRNYPDKMNFASPAIVRLFYAREYLKENKKNE